MSKQSTKVSDERARRLDIAPASALRRFFMQQCLGIGESKQSQLASAVAIGLIVVVLLLCTSLINPLMVMVRDDFAGPTRPESLDFIAALNAAFMGMIGASTWLLLSLRESTRVRVAQQAQVAGLPPELIGKAYFRFCFATALLLMSAPIIAASAQLALLYPSSMQLGRFTMILLMNLVAFGMCFSLASRPLLSLSRQFVPQSHFQRVSATMRMAVVGGCLSVAYGGINYMLQREFELGLGEIALWQLADAIQYSEHDEIVIACSKLLISFGLALWGVRATLSALERHFDPRAKIEEDPARPNQVIRSKKLSAEDVMLNYRANAIPAGLKLGGMRAGWLLADRQSSRSLALFAMIGLPLFLAILALGLRYLDESGGKFLILVTTLFGLINALKATRFGASIASGNPATPLLETPRWQQTELWRGIAAYNFRVMMPAMLTGGLCGGVLASEFELNQMLLLGFLPIVALLLAWTLLGFPGILLALVHRRHKPKLAERFRDSISVTLLTLLLVGLWLLNGLMMYSSKAVLIVLGVTFCVWITLKGWRAERQASVIREITSQPRSGARRIKLAIEAKTHPKRRGSKSALRALSATES